MLMINEVRILGYLGDDPEIHTTQQGGETRKLARFSVATSEYWTDKETGEKKEKVEWHRIVAFGKTAEVAEKYLMKGSLVLVQGKLRTERWQDSTGVERSSTSIAAQGRKSIILLDKPKIQEMEESIRGEDDIPFAA